eukprot:jgi/Phyca11/119873/e_gw1.40.431.1
MASEGKTSSGLEQFKGKGYAMWKDKLVSHINTQDQLYKRKQLEKGLPEEERVTYRWGVMDWERAKGDLQNLLNQVLPIFFIYATRPSLANGTTYSDEGTRKGLWPGRCSWTHRTYSSLVQAREELVA